MRVCLLTRGMPSGDPSDPLGRLARGLVARHGVALTLVVTERPASPGAALDGVPLRRPQDVAEERFDVAVATSWPTTAHLFAVRATRHAYRVEELVHHRMGGWNGERVPAALSYALPVDFLATTPAAQAALADLRPDARCLLTPDGLAHERFPPGAPRAPGAALRIVVVAAADGGPPDGARAALTAMTEPCATSTLPPDAGADARAALYAAADVLLALDPDADPSRLVLEAMAAGVACVVLPGPTGAEPVDHAASGLLAEPDDPRGTAGQLDRLARDPELLGKLRAGAIARAAAHPDWDAATAALHAALEVLVAEDPPDVCHWPERLMADAMAAAALWHNEHHRLAGALRQLETSDAYRVGSRLQRLWDAHPAVTRVARPLARRGRRRLLGS